MNIAERPRVLIAEDDAILNDGIARQLARMGYPMVGQAYGGSEAVRLACLAHPEVVLMDLQMTDEATGREDKLAGLKAAREIGKQSPAAVIVLTAHDSPDLVGLAADAGVSGFLVKPASDQELNRAMMIGRARFQDSLEWHRQMQACLHQNEELRAALTETRRLSGLLSVCSWCKKVHGQGEDWEEMESYVRKHSAARFSHGICPDCFEKVVLLDPPSHDI